MSIPTSGLAALLAVASLALSSCGGDNGSVTTTTTVSPGSGGETATQTVAAATTTAPKTTTTTQTTTPEQTTTQKAKTIAPASKPASSKPPSPRCPSVDVGVRAGDIDETYARITSVSNVNCNLVTYIVQQWGGQRIGRDKALLPLDWSCNGNTCRKGRSSLSFVLEAPSGSD